MKKEFLYIFSAGRVAKINGKSGEIVWETKLKDQGVKVYNGYCDIRVSDDKIFIGISGYLVCLKESDGSLIWKNELKGWGYNFISIANDAANQSEKASMAAATAAAIAAGT